MTISVSAALPLTSEADFRATRTPSEAAEMKQRFEQMVWADVLRNAGFESTLTKGGGEGAAAFARYMIEAIAEELAITHPLGLADSLGGPGEGPSDQDTTSTEQEFGT